MTRQYLHFTLGPVQGFVAQARRTRDFWSGSFLLSWLTAVAVQQTRQAGGEILFPMADQHFLDWLQGEGGNTPPQQGSIPNRFKAEVPPDFDPRQVVDAVQHAWRQLADQIWRSDLADIQPSADTRAIWDRQIASFWEINWALADDKSASDLLDRRKNLRNHLPPPEPGIKCMMMDGLQELSGAARPLGSDRDDQLTPFWQRLRAAHRDLQYDLREGEYLCAIAFIKRRFARHFPDFAITMPGGWPLVGWQLPLATPSVAYLAAAPWLAQLLDRAAGDEQLQQQLWEFHDQALDPRTGISEGHPESRNQPRCIRHALADYPAGRKWAALDGNLFYDHALENPRLWNSDGERATTLKRLAGQLRRLRKQAGLEPISPFYAILLMDGDSLGSQMSDPAKQDNISRALQGFTQGVREQVEAKDGFLIYAGGDDVLALLPLQQAIPCAASLRQLYLDQFAPHPEIETSLSGAIQFAHIGMPLGTLLGDAHQLLDGVAKDATGRDALAIRIWKPGGLQQQWARPWARLLNPSSQPDAPVSQLEQLANHFVGDGDAGERGYSSGFFYRMRELFNLLNPKRDKHAPDLERGEPALDPEVAVNLLAAEYVVSGVNLSRTHPLDIDQARHHLAPLLEQCRPCQRISKDQYQDANHWQADAALIIRFLATRGIDS
jgi:CRISPR-associated protein Cmr2